MASDKATATAEQPDAPVLTAKTVKACEAIRADFVGYRESYGLMKKTAAQLAPRFMTACLAWQAEMKAAQRKSSFIAFVQYLDPSVPDDRDGYRAHPSYQAADNLKTVAGKVEAAALKASQAGSGEAAEGEGSGQGQTVSTDRKVLMGVLRTLLDWGVQQSHIRATLIKTHGYTEKRVDALLTGARDEKPLIKLPGARPAAKIEAAKTRKAS